MIRREIIQEFFEENLQTHTDWTGTRVETKYECDSIDKFVDRFMNYLENLI